MLGTHVSTDARMLRHLRGSLLVKKADYYKSGLKECSKYNKIHYGNHDKNNEDNNNIHHDKQAARSRKQAILFYSESHQRLLWGLSMFAVP